MKSVYEFTSDAPKKQKMDASYTRWPLWMLEYIKFPDDANTLASVLLMHSMAYLRSIAAISSSEGAVSEFFEQTSDRICGLDDDTKTSKELEKDAIRWLNEILDGLSRFAQDRADRSTILAIRKFMMKEIKTAYKDN